MKELIEKLLEEVDADIKLAMVKENERGEKAWEWLQNPILTILEWQKLRDRRENANS
mgnify:CR=1 FL=1